MWLGERGASCCTVVLRTDVCIVVQAPHTWLAEHGAAALEHPMRDALFLGMDERGDLIPTRALRDKFRQPRQDIFPPDEGPAGDAPPMGPD